VSQTDADRFKAKAEECRRMAEQATTVDDSEGWLRLATEWDKLAETAAQRRGIFNRYDNPKPP